MHTKFLYSLHLTLFVLLQSVLQTPSRAHAQGLYVSPNCGSRSTHFIVGTGGWPYPPGKCGGPGECLTSVRLTLDGDAGPFYIAPSCATSFSIDLADFPLLFFNRGNGTHTIHAFGYYECPSSYHAGSPRAACFELRDTAGDPWDVMKVTPDSAWITMRLLPGGACDIPNCDSLHFAQVVRMLGIDSTGVVRNLSFAEQYAFDTSRAALAEKLDARVTPAGYTVDMKDGSASPFLTYRRFFGFAGSKLAQIAQDADLMDSPQRSDFSYTDDIRTILLEYELNAFCAAGEGQGQWLGQCRWTWRRKKGAADFAGICSPGTCTRDQPTPQFRAALDSFLVKTGVSIPIPPKPSKGNPCP